MPGTNCGPFNNPHIICHAFIPVNQRRTASFQTGLLNWLVEKIAQFPGRFSQECELRGLDNDGNIPILGRFRQFRAAPENFSLGPRLAGGEGGIRTPDRGVSPYNGLANRRLQPLGHLSGGMRLLLL